MKLIAILPSIILMQLFFTFYHLNYRELWIIRLNRRVIAALVNKKLKQTKQPSITHNLQLLLLFVNTLDIYLNIGYINNNETNNLMTNTTTTTVNCLTIGNINNAITKGQ